MKTGIDRMTCGPTTGGLGVAWVARDEFGEGTARIRASEADPEGKSLTQRTVLLSCSKPTTLQGLADIITEGIGWQDRPLDVMDVGAEELMNYHAEAEIGPKSREFIGMWATSSPSMNAGETAGVDASLQKLLGRPLRSMRESVRKTLQVKELFSV